jgi:hypothetical protein
MGGELAWDNSTLLSEKDIILTLTKDEVEEVKAALQYFNGKFAHRTDVLDSHQRIQPFIELGLYGSEVSANNFPLPTLGQKLLKVTLDIHRGKGFAIIRGLDPKDYSPEDNLIIFLGISSYIGNMRGRQDEDGNMLSTFPVT